MSSIITLPTPKDQLGFPSLAEILPEGKSGTWKIGHYSMDEDFVKHEQLMAALRGSWTMMYLVPGTYAVLYNNGSVIMSDTWLERYTNLDIIREANGHVLIAGLGVGLILTRILDKPDVESVTVVELSVDVISLVAPHYVHPKLWITNADIYKWQTEEKYDTIYFDIWGDISGDNYEETKVLHKRYRRNLNRKNPDCYMNSWLRDEVKRLHFQDR